MTQIDIKKYPNLRLGKKSSENNELLTELIEKYNTHDTGKAELISGSGAPASLLPENTIYKDTDTGDLYMNVDGVNKQYKENPLVGFRQFEGERALTRDYAYFRVIVESSNETDIAISDEDLSSFFSGVDQVLIYYDGEVHSHPITGTYYNTQSGEFHIQFSEAVTGWEEPDIFFIIAPNGSGQPKSVAIGDGNIASRFNSIAIGQMCRARNTGAIAIGYGNIADVVEGIAIGRYAHAHNLIGMEAFSSNSFIALPHIGVGDSQVTRWTWNKTTYNDTPITMGNKYFIPSGKVVYLKITVLGVIDETPKENCLVKSFNVYIYNNGNHVKPTQSNNMPEGRLDTQGALALDAVLDVSTSGVTIELTGHPTKMTRWTALYEGIEMGFTTL